MSMIDVACKLYERLYASPLTSCLHKLCMDDGKDIHEQYIKGGVDIAFVDVLGVGTLTDSLCAIKKMVYEDKILTISEVLNALKNNFDGENGQRIRKILMKAPKYGNNDPYADAMAREIDRIGCEFMDKHTACFNGYNICYRQTSVTAHVPFGACVGLRLMDAMHALRFLTGRHLLRGTIRMVPLLFCSLSTLPRIAVIYGVLPALEYKTDACQCCRR